MGPDGALTSDEVNFLIYRYLLEAGFTHSAFVFGCESTVAKVDIDGKEVPIGALVSFIQKGFQFMELEANLTEDGSDVYGKYTTLSARDILTKDIKELREAAKDLKLAAADDKGGVAPPPPPAPTPAAAPAALELAPDALRELEGHDAEVLSMAWAPGGALATGSADGTARIWDPATGTSVQCAPLPDTSPGEDLIIGVDWAPDGSALAAVTASGALAVWESSGGLRHVIPSVSGAATLALQWSRGGSHLASGGADGTVTLWDPSSGAQQQQWKMPGGGPVYDVHWRDDAELAAAGEDGWVATFRVGESAPLRASKEHGPKMDAGDGAGGAAPPPFPGAPSPETVNMVRWDAAGRHLASAANDMTVGLWPADPGAPPRLLAGHKREVMAVAWGGPSGGLLASSSADGAVRLWASDAERPCVGVLDRHEEGITCMSWEPEGGRLATGDAAGNVTVWAVAADAAGVHGRMLATLRGAGQVADVQWVNDGAALAVAFAGSPAVVVADIPGALVFDF